MLDDYFINNKFPYALDWKIIFNFLIYFLYSSRHLKILYY